MQFIIQVSRLEIILLFTVAQNHEVPDFGIIQLMPQIGAFQSTYNFTLASAEFRSSSLISYASFHHKVS